MAKRATTRKIVIHCAATRADQNVDVEWIRKDHLRRGFSDVGYHLVITRDGVVQAGRPIEEVGAHAVGHNATSVAICLVGGLDAQGKPENNFTAAQWAALRVAHKFLKAMYPGAETVGHRDLSPDLDGDGVIEPHEWLKACPCFDVGEWLRQGRPVPFNG